MVEVFCDGASSGNPGNSGIGVCLFQNSKKTKEISLFVGQTTNNVAEYFSLIVGLNLCLSLGLRKATFFMDSKLVVEQVNGRFKVKNQNLFGLCALAKHFLSFFESAEVLFTEREGNRFADELAKKGSQQGMLKDRFQLPAF